MGEWIGERLNRCEGPVRFLIPEGGVSALDAPGQPFHDPDADAALFEAIEQTSCTRPNRRLIRLPHHINDPAFAAASPRSATLSRQIARERTSRRCRASTARPSSRNSGPWSRRASRSSAAAPAPAFGQMRGGRRHRPDRDLQFRPLPHGRARLARRPARLWQRQRDRHRDGRARCCRSSSTRRCWPASTAPIRSA